MEDKGILDLMSENDNLYIYQGPEGRILFSLLKIKDYSAIRETSQKIPNLVPELEEDIWNKCVVEHSTGLNIDEQNAGTVTTLSQIIMKLSGPNSKEDLEESISKARKETEDIIEQLILKVCEAFPGYKPEEVENFSWEILTKRVAQAEKILNKELEFSDKPTDDLLGGDVQETIDVEAIRRELSEA